jgi:hypothetical protein
VSERRSKGTGQVTFGSDREAEQQEAAQAMMPTAEQALVTPQERFGRIERAIEEIAGTLPPRNRDHVIQVLRGEA